MTGYILVDLTGIDLNASESATVTGAYAKVSEAIATNKPIIIEGLINDDISISPISAVVYTDTDGIEIEFNTTKITISSADSVSISSLIPTPEANTTKSTKSTK